MKGAAVVLFCVLTIVRGANLPDYQCRGENKDILLPHENCNQFYQCSSEGNLLVQNCAGNLYFNPETQQCDWPENVDCTNSDDIENPNDETCEIDSQLLPHENCNQFYVCANGKLVEFNCPGHLLFNSETGECDYPKNVNCERNSTPQPGNPDDSESTSVPPMPTPAPEPESSESCEDDNDDDDNNDDDNGNNDVNTKCAADDSDGVLMPHRNCNQFYKCSEGAPLIMTCPPKLLYNTATEQCDSPHEVDCGNRKRFRKFFSIEKEVVVNVALSLKKKNKTH